MATVKGACITGSVPQSTSLVLTPTCCVLTAIHKFGILVRLLTSEHTPCRRQLEFLISFQPRAAHRQERRSCAFSAFAQRQTGEAGIDCTPPGLGDRAVESDSNAPKPRSLAVGQHQWLHFGVGAPPILVYFSGDSDVHWGYRVLTQTHLMIIYLPKIGLRIGPPRKAPISS